MILSCLYRILLITLFNLFLFNTSYSDVIKKIEIIGNDRIPNETIIIFSKANIDDNISSYETNDILKNLYDTNFFKDIKVNLENNTLRIEVIENPIINNITFEGIKSSRIKEMVVNNLDLKERSSFNEIFIKQDKEKILLILQELGYFFAKVDVFVETIPNNQVNIKNKITLGKKSKISKISFIGDKKVKDKRLRSLIVSEEYKFWKFLSGKKYLNKNTIKLDERLLKNYYLNKGFYNVSVNSSFAKLIDDNEFELIFNINANNKVFFGDLSLDLPADYDDKNFSRIKNLFTKLNGTNYSINKIKNILDEIDEIIMDEQYESIKASIDENLIGDKLNIKFNISETEKIFIEKINILGNNVTAENVIRNYLYIDEGDPFNDILQTKSINNLNSLGFFKSVNSEIIPGKNEGSKIINISVKEKPTGEIMAGAGFGTTGSSFKFGVKENNFLGKGLSVDSNLDLSTDSIKGQFSIVNPNYNNSDKLVRFNVSATEIDRLTKSGYKTNKTGFSVGAGFEYLDDLYLNLGTSNFYENLDTDASASARQKAQEGNYFDSFLNIDLNYDKRNQKFQTSKGFRSSFTTNIPLISKTYTLSNTYKYKYFTEFYEDNISTFSFLFKASNSINDKNIKLSERMYIPSSSLRGFESGKVGPKDGTDYVGGNYVSALNFSSTLPQVFPTSQNTDFLFFVDVANIWGVDYDSALDDNEIRSSLGFAIDWYTPIGPLNFSFAQPITKSTNDITETFRFNLGTTF